MKLRQISSALGMEQSRIIILTISMEEDIAFKENIMAM